MQLFLRVKTHIMKLNMKEIEYEGLMTVWPPGLRLQAGLLFKRPDRLVVD
jgi:hypothetical protein